MTKRKHQAPVTRTKHPQPSKKSEEWVIWAAWADRVTFEEIFEQTGLTEAQVIRLMRKLQTPSTFKRWRKRVSGRSTKHRKRFIQMRSKAPNADAPVIG